MFSDLVARTPRDRARRCAVAVATALLLAGAVGCAGPEPEPFAWTGGPTPAPTVPMSLQPSQLPRGPGVRTGIVIGDVELVLYFWGGSPQRPFLDVAWLNPTTSRFVDWPRSADGTVIARGGGGSADVSAATAFLEISQLKFVGYPLVEFGTIRAHPARIVVEAQGSTAAASFTASPYDPQVTIFWLQRGGEPNPADTPAGEGRWLPEPPELYPIVTAYDAAGTVIDSVRLRGTGSSQRGG